MKVKILVMTIAIINIMIVTSQVETISIPKFDDHYSKTVDLLESGETVIDYKEFRESFLDSKQFRIALKKSSELLDLTKKLYEIIPKKQFPEIIMIAKAMLSIDYTNMRAHKILRQTYEYMGDSLNSKKYKAIQFGLLKSIVNDVNRDGKSCKTAWEVINISEEYFVLNILGAKLNRQSIDYSGGICDKMEVMVNGNSKTYFFDVEKLLITKQNLNKN